MDIYTFGTWLRRRRKSLDWTQADLARRANCTAATIRKIEADERKPSRQLAGLLADALGVPPEEHEAFLKAARSVGPAEGFLRSVPAPAGKTAPNNLPAPLTSFIDRVNDSAVVVGMLTSADVRLLTLVGPPGIGKTRLCIRCAENLVSSFPDGVWFVDLAAVADSSGVLPAIARVLGIAESGAVTPAQQLRTTLKDQHALLALDNCEHVTDMAPDVVELLRGCAGLKVLATSRTPLHVYGEHEYELPPLALPPRYPAPGRLMTFESAQLFVARVREHRPGFAITTENAGHVAEICIRLDGVPLALELAAASLRWMTLAQLHALLADQSRWLASLKTPARDLPARQRTLYNAIAWSYGLLDAPAQTVFRRLSVLAGRFDVEAALGVCGQDPPSVRSAIATLADHRLLTHEAERWRMLEMIRAFAWEQLSADEVALLRQRHASYFASRLAAIGPDASRIELAHDDFRAALRWAIGAGDGLLAFRMCSVLADFWETRGYLREGLAWAREVLGITQNLEPSQRIAFLSSVGHLAWNRHEFEAALEFTRQGIALAHANGLKEALAGMFNVLARIHLEQGDYERAEPALRECIALARESHNAAALGRATAQLGELALARGRLAEAQATSEQALALLEGEGERFTCMVHTNLAEVAMARGDRERARSELQQALPLVKTHIRRQLCYLSSLAGWFIGREHADQDDLRRGVELLAAAEATAERTGAPPSAMYRSLNEKRAAMARRGLADGDWQAAWDRGRDMSRDHLNAAVFSTPPPAGHRPGARSHFGATEP